MKSIFLSLILILAALPAVADDRISNEIATVKACNEAVTKGAIDLSTVTNAVVTDSESLSNLTVELDFTKDNGSCKQWFWFNYDGTPSQCDNCHLPPPPGGPYCACIKMMCSLPDKSVQTEYVQFNR